MGTLVHPSQPAHGDSLMWPRAHSGCLNGYQSQWLRHTHGALQRGLRQVTSPQPDKQSEAPGRLSAPAPNSTLVRAATSPRDPLLSRPSTPRQGKPALFQTWSLRSE
ncbi:hypothetical protein GHT09_019840 [Marmota monax]|uniref:Uncharacterized protein n=1 Tax=Marmota monax TaxID=9995 RepID=A0A834PIH1_MARMO|nr:hypothetical protein GHT09_019840 [Marmota monax]